MTGHKKEQILRIIDEYIYNTDSRYAVLLDGAWGCGKTYFAKNNIIPYIKRREEERSRECKEYKSKKVIYLSIYGVACCDEISKKMWLQTIPFTDGKKYETVRSYVEKASALGGVLLSQNNISIENLDFAKLLNPERIILIIDDIERSNIEINALMGYINSFVEHDGIKTILLANQEEIGKANLSRNLEMKYIVALNENLKYQTPEKNTNNTNSSKSSFQKRDIISRIEHLFKNELIYSQIKEKLIGITINFEPDMNEMLQCFVHQMNFEHICRNLLMNEGEFVSNCAQQFKHENLRTLQFALERFKTIYSFIDELPNSKELEAAIKLIFEYCYVLSIIHKKGLEVPAWSSHSEYGYRRLSSSEWNFAAIMGFRFVDDFINYAVYNKKHIEGIVNEYCNELLRKSNTSKSALADLSSSWWELDDEEIQSLVNTIMDGINTDEYAIGSFLTIIALFLKINKIGFSIDMNRCLDMMKPKISAIKPEEKNIFFRHHVRVENDVKEDYNKIVQELQSLIPAEREENLCADVDTFFTRDKNWGNKLYEHVYENRKKYMFEKKFLSLVDVDNAVNCILNSRAIDISNLRQTLITVYDYEDTKNVFESDIQSIEMMLQMLTNSQFATIEKTVSFNLELLKKQLTEYLSKQS